jgi:hypothetical protein
MNLKSFTKNNILSVVSSLILFASVPVVLAWTSPSATPPNANVPAPVNVGLNYQIKQGKLGLFGPDTALRVSKVDSYVPTNVPLLSTLLVGVNGKVGAAEYCDERGENCIDLGNLPNVTNTNTNTNSSTTCSYRQKVVIEPLYLSASNNKTSSKEFTIPAGQWKITGQGSINGAMGGAPKVSMVLSKGGTFDAKTQKTLFTNKYAKVQCSGKTCVEYWQGPWSLKDEAKNNFTFTTTEKLRVSASQTTLTGTLVFTSPEQERVCVSE